MNALRALLDRSRDSHLQQKAAAQGNHQTRRGNRADRPTRRHTLDSTPLTPPVLSVR